MNKTIAKIAYILSVILFGTIGMFLRYTHFPSEVVALFRGTLGSCFLIFLYIVRGKRIDWHGIRNNAVWLLLSGAFLGLNWVFLFAAYRQTSVAVASLCNYMAPIIVVALSPFLYKEHLSAGKLACVIAAFAGIILVSDVRSESANIPGILLGLAAAAVFVGIILCNRKLHDLEGFDKVFVQLAVSAVTVLPYVIVVNYGKPLHIDMQSVLITLMLGVVHTGVAYCLYLMPLGILPVQSIALLGYIEPVVSVLCSAVILHEALSVSGLMGAILIIGAAAAGEIVP